MKFCSICSTALEFKIPPSDSRKRAVCPCCETVHYVNPKIVVGTIPVWKEHILLCRRAIEPQYGLWTLPAGFMEIAETTTEGAVRETLEETGARVEVKGLYSMIDVPHIQQVHLFFKAELLDLAFNPGDESLEVRLFSPKDIPWDTLAFLTVHNTLKWFVSEQNTGHYNLHVDVVDLTAKPTQLAL